MVDAFDNPDAAADLATYRSYFRLGSATFVKYNQNGEEKNIRSAVPRHKATGASRSIWTSR